MKDKNAKGYILPGLILLVFIAITAILVDNPSISSVEGAFAAALVSIILSVWFKVPMRTYYLILVFVFLASPIGSIVNLYRIWGPYDKIVHFMSGILFASIGIIFVKKLLKKEEWHEKEMDMVMIMFAFLFSSAIAGIWEIFEFTADKVMGEGMQRGMVDTVTDMIAGNLGALGFTVYELIRIKTDVNGRKTK